MYWNSGVDTYTIMWWCGQTCNYVAQVYNYALYLRQVVVTMGKLHDFTCFSMVKL